MLGDRWPDPQFFRREPLRRCLRPARTVSGTDRRMNWSKWRNPRTRHTHGLRIEKALRISPDRVGPHCSEVRLRRRARALGAAVLAKFWPLPWGRLTLSNRWLGPTELRKKLPSSLSSYTSPAPSHVWARVSVVGSQWPRGIAELPGGIGISPRHFTCRVLAQHHRR